MKTLCFAVTIGMLMSVFSVFCMDEATSQNLDKSLQQLKTALNDHQFNLVKPLLDEDFSYGGSGCAGYCDANIQAMKKIIEDYPHQITEIHIDEIKTEATDYRVIVTYTFAEGEPAREEILMNDTGVFLEMAIPRIKVLFASPDTAQDKPAADQECCD